MMKIRHICCKNHDGRVIFVIPYEGDFSLIGTTDVEHDDSADRVMISHDEINTFARLLIGTSKNSFVATMSFGPTPVSAPC